LAGQRFSVSSRRLSAILHQACDNYVFAYTQNNTSPVSGAVPGSVPWQPASSGTNKCLEPLCCCRSATSSPCCPRCGAGGTVQRTRFGAVLLGREFVKIGS
jgi:hypothetical protein